MPFLFEVGGGEPPTPQQVREAAVRRLRHRQTHERMLTEAIPVVMSIRENLRELTRLGVEDDRLDKVRHAMATLQDDMQTYLVQPPPAEPDTSG